LGLSARRQLIEVDPEVSMVKQCQILGVCRSGLYYEKKPQFSREDLEVLNRMDEIYTQSPFYGYRKQYEQLMREKFNIGIHRVRLYMRILDFSVIYPRKKTTLKNKTHPVYPYLLRKITIKHPNQVWAGDITYIRLEKGFCYLVAIIDWFSRYILSWRISNTLDADFCIEALDEAIQKFPLPHIFNSDQGSQYTSTNHTKKLLKHQIKISMDSVGRWADNVIIERFWRSLKVENIYPIGYDSPKTARKGCAEYITYYNQERLHAGLDYRTPREVYWSLN